MWQLLLQDLISPELPQYGAAFVCHWCPFKTRETTNYGMVHEHNAHDKDKATIQKLREIASILLSLPHLQQLSGSCTYLEKGMDNQEVERLLHDNP